MEYRKSGTCVKGCGQRVDFLCLKSPEDTLVLRCIECGVLHYTRYPYNEEELAWQQQARNTENLETALAQVTFDEEAWAALLRQAKIHDHYFRVFKE